MFQSQFEFLQPALVNFVGGGGKTAVILRLLDEYSESVAAVYTTTTRMHPPHPSDGMAILASDNEEYLHLLLESALLGWCRGCRFIVTHLPTSPDFLAGVTPGFINRLDRALFPVVLNEADGARSMSLKIPREGEPVLMTGANYLVPVIGLDCLNRPLGPDTLFRWELAATKLHLKAGRPLTPDLAASLLLHPRGVCKDWKPGTRIIPFINKVDSEADDMLAHALAKAMLGTRHFPVEHVVLGSVKNSRAFSLTA